MFKAWKSTPSGCAIVVREESDIVAGVNFARENKVRLVIKGTGHDYYGRSTGPRDSLLIWTHDLRDITVHQKFVAEGAPKGMKGMKGVTAVTTTAGDRWLETYKTASAAGLYVQGGGCTSVGACGGFALGGGFGPFSKRYGSGGTFGVVTHMTVLAHPEPKISGWIAGPIVAKSDAAYRELLERYVSFVASTLSTPVYREGVILNPDYAVATSYSGMNVMQVGTSFLDITTEQAEVAWAPFLSELKARPNDFDVNVTFTSEPFAERWRPTEREAIFDDRAKAPTGYFWWKGNASEVAAYWGAYDGRGVPFAMTQCANVVVLAQALFDASRTSLVLWQTNKALHGEHPEARKRDKTTSIYPAVFDNVAFITIGA